jgi:peptidoglycan/xylan/chitin deacetylase (PgdA/CDA1 family)
VTRFEEEQVRRRKAPAATFGPPPASADLVRFRRRRLGAAVIVVLALAAIVIAVSGSSGHTQTKGTKGATSSTLLHLSPKAEDNVADAVSAVLAYTPFVREGGTKGHDVALTFDDGPGPYTPGVLSVLERLHVHATFFAIGRMERYFSVSTARELRDGDVVGDHTEDHPMLALMSAHEQKEQLFEQIARIELLGGPRPTLFRPPYGSFNATTMRELHALHLLMVLWSVDTGDYQLPGVEAIVQRALEGAHPGAIILMHDGGGDRSQTIAALPQIIAGLRAKGLQPVTVPTLLRDDPPPAGQPLPRSLSGD